MKEKFGDEGVRTTPHGHGVPQRSAEDSVYYHPVNNPTGTPPPGRPQRYRDDVDLMDPAKADEAEAALRARMRAPPAAASRSSDAIEASGTTCFTCMVLLCPVVLLFVVGSVLLHFKCFFLSLPAAVSILFPVRVFFKHTYFERTRSQCAGSAGAILPPPDHPPPGVLPPPDGPPPGVHMLPAGVLPPPSDAPPGVILPPPTAPPPGMLAAPPGPPPLPHGALPPPVGLPPGMLPPAANLAELTGAPQVTAAKPVETIMEGAATALKTIPAQQDSKLTCMVPAALRAKRHKEKGNKKDVHIIAPGKDRSFGLAPSSLTTKATDAPDSTLDAFMSEIANL